MSGIGDGGDDEEPLPAKTRHLDDNSSEKSEYDSEEEEEDDLMMAY